MSKGSLLASSLACALAATAFAVGLLHLGARLWEIQVHGAAGYGLASDRQSVRRVRTAGLRGRILDRGGRLLADNRVAVSIVCHPAWFQKRTWSATVAEIDRAIRVIAARIGRPSPLTEAAIRRHVNQSPSLPLFVWRDIDADALAVFSENQRAFSGFSVVETDERVYPFGPLAAHLLGYVGRDQTASNAGDEKFSYAMREMCGRAGLEAYYDGFLRGVPGEKRMLVDARGFAIREWTVVESQKGPDLMLSLDAGIQQVVERELSGVCGACVVMNPQSGEVLALASAPSFDPNRFVPSLGVDLYSRLTNDPDKPLLNRAAGGAYAPGSTFKPITALAGLTLGYPEDERYLCEGKYACGQMCLHCASRWGHGELDLRHALMKSCNPFFCNLGAEAGTNALISAARSFGLGAKTGIDFGVDMAGVVPDAAWKQKMYHERWYFGDLLQMSIGQGMLLASPLQMARVAGALGTGWLVTPRLKRGMSIERRRLPFSEENLRIVREGMRLVVAGDGESRGSGWKAGEGVAVAVSGKTGTAEVGQGERRRKNTWFIGYAPSETPQVAFAMVVENGVSGGGTTAPKVGAVLKKIFNGR